MARALLSAWRLIRAAAIVEKPSQRRSLENAAAKYRRKAEGLVFALDRAHRHLLREGGAA